MVTPLVRDRIAQLVTQAIERARQDGAVRLESTPDILIERPSSPDHGDFATSLPLRLARATRINPLKLAEMLVERMPASGEVSRVEAAPPGFVNFFLETGWLQQQVEAIRRTGADYGNVDFGQQRRVMVEFVSVNPHRPGSRGPHPRRGAGQFPGQCSGSRRVRRYPRVLRQRRRQPDGRLLSFGLRPLPGMFRRAGRVPFQRLPGRIHRRPGPGNHRRPGQPIPDHRRVRRTPRNRRPGPRKNG